MASDSPAHEHGSAEKDLQLNEPQSGYVERRGSRVPYQTEATWSPCPRVDAPPCRPLECVANPDLPDCDQTFETGGDDGFSQQDICSADAFEKESRKELRCKKKLSARSKILCTANGKRPQESDFDHCPIAQSFVRCGPHHRAKIKALTLEDVEALFKIWKTYQDDLTYPWYSKKPVFSHEDYLTFNGIAEKVVNAMVDEYKEPMVLDQATLSNTNHIGHPPHADNVQFDSVWWEGKRIRKEDEVQAAQEGAYVLWRAEKTSHRSYSCSVALSDPNGYEGGEIQFFSRWGDKDPIETCKNEIGTGIAFCGCQRNIHAVTGVRSGFRLVFLVWTRPPHVRVPDSQCHVCYFRPGTGLGVWLTTADQQKAKAPKELWQSMQKWSPKDEEDSDCKCEACELERTKVSWSDCRPQKKLGVVEADAPTPSTSVGNSPRTCNNDSSIGEHEGSSSEEGDRCSALEDIGSNIITRHCLKPQAAVRCCHHNRNDLKNVLSKADVTLLHDIWNEHHDDLTKPWYDKKPEFTDIEFQRFRDIAQKVVKAMEAKYDQSLVLDQAIISSTNHIGLPPHADNVQFDSVWWEGKQIKQRDEIIATRDGAEVLWRATKTSYRNYGATVALTSPWEYGDGQLEFFRNWGEKDPFKVYNLDKGSGVAYCGCQKNIHAVKGVKWGFRLTLLVWTRPPEVVVPEEQTHVCYFMPGTGLSVWLTSADLIDYEKKNKKRHDVAGWWQESWWDESHAESCYTKKKKKPPERETWNWQHDGDDDEESIISHEECSAEEKRAETISTRSWRSKS